MIALPDDIEFWATIRHFDAWEFECKCGESGCDLHGMDKQFIRDLDAFRDFCGITFVVTSGYRCPMHPIEIRKKHPGPHQTGMAVDINVWGTQAIILIYKLGQYFDSTGRKPFGGIGMNQKGARKSRFVHLDNAPPEFYRQRPWPWTY